MTLQKQKVVIHHQLFVLLNASTSASFLNHQHNIASPLPSSSERGGKIKNTPTKLNCKFSMKNSISDQVVAIPKSLARGFREHVKFGPKISDTVKRRLRLGARIVQGGGMQRMFKKVFSVGKEEKLLKVSQCYLSTTAGPISGLLFISTEKIAFCSETSLRFTCSTGEIVRTYYKVLIPLKKIKKATQSENVNNPREKYIEIVTLDNFDFWFMGFVNYQKASKCLHQVLISQSSIRQIDSKRSFALHLLQR